MNKVFKNKIFILLIAVVILAEIVFLMKDGAAKVNLRERENPQSASVPKTLTGEDIAGERVRWSKMMDDIGPEKAYEQFKKEYENVNFGVQHTMAHIIGQLIYKKKGLSGLTICDSTFAFGCYHSFYSEALADKGPSVIPIADKLCIDKFGPLGTGCQHGIGHGLMDFYGPEKLSQALDACGMTTQLKKLFGCTSGVFMEYNVPILVSETSAQTVPRVLDKKNPYAPCPGLAEKYRESCYYEMPQWWDKDTTFNGDYKKIGELCQAVSEPNSRESCFLGIGNVAAPSSNYVVAGTVEKCEKMPTAESKVICLSGSSWSFFSSVTYRSLAEKVCAGLDDETRKKCVQKSDLIGNGLQ